MDTDMEATATDMEALCSCIFSIRSIPIIEAMAIFSVPSWLFRIIIVRSSAAFKNYPTVKISPTTISPLMRTASPVPSAMEPYTQPSITPLASMITSRRRKPPRKKLNAFDSNFNKSIRYSSKICKLLQKLLL